MYPHKNSVEQHLVKLHSGVIQTTLASWHNLESYYCLKVCKSAKLIQSY